MATTLYRKYRPQKFNELTAQNHVKVTLANEVAREEVAHAFLFAGPRGVGKTTTARILAKAVNCKAREPGAGEPCDACPSCDAITAGRSLDVIEIDAASHTGVDHVREQIIDHARFVPAELAYKVFIIDEVHMLSASAFNALLKTLEEPPPRVLFILATTELHKVPETVISRCQRFDFHKITVADLVERLAHLAVEEGVSADRRVLEVIARSAEGSVRDAESLMGQILALGEKEITAETAALVLPHSDAALAREFLESAARASPAAAFAVVKKIVDTGIDPVQFSSDCLVALQTLLHHALSSGLDAAFDIDEETRAFAERLRGSMPLSVITAMMEETLRTRAALKESDAGILPLEIAAVRLSECAGLSAPVSSLPRENSAAAGATVVHGDPSLADVSARWNDVVAAVGDGSRSLPTVLVSARPIRLTDGALTIGVAHQFHLARLLEEKNRRLVESAVARIFSAPLRLDAEILRTGTVAGEDDPLRSALNTLGGQMVE